MLIYQVKFEFAFKLNIFESFHIFLNKQDIPHFKEVVIMATVCDACGHKDNEVKGGSGIEPKGTKITLKITDPTDMSRDVLKVC